MNTLSVHQLYYRAPGGGPQLTNISFDLPAGQRLAVIGPNGSGKSTLLCALMGALKACHDQVFLGGVPFSHLSPATCARKIAYLAQQDEPDLRLRVIEYIALGRLPWAGASTPLQDSQSIERALALTGLMSLSRRRLATLSGGERQRAALARALAQSPDLLLLDEPTNHLDPAGRNTLLARVKKLGISVIATLHDLSAIDRFADRVLLLKNGAQAAYGTAEQVLTTACLRPVLGMESFIVPHPVNGAPLRIFDTPDEKEITHGPR